MCLEVQKAVKCPNVSIDISENNGDLHLLEYQTRHFAILGGDPDYYFELENASWQKLEIIQELDNYIGIGIRDYIKDLVINSKAFM